jgi:tRNA A-37 threonylcarbamoyl transferase component Bud32
MHPDTHAPHLDAPLLVALARHEADGPSREEAQLHLSSCGACRSALESLRAGPEGVLDTVARVSPAEARIHASTPTEMVARIGAGTPVATAMAPSSGLAQLPFFQPGLVAGKFRPLRVIGAGGMGVVVAAEHVQLHQRVALKFMQPEIVGQTEATGRFLREARAAASLRSEHVCRVIDLGQLEGGLPYIVMEYLEGESLEQLLARRGPLPAHEVAGYLADALEAIGEAHASGIVHRDLKPGNLWLAMRPDGRPRIKVLDFGISKAPRGELQQGVTSANAVLGTPVYMAPEQLFSPAEVDGRSDLWAVGCILHQLTTGALPFEASSFADLAARVRTTDPRPVRALRPELPAAFEAVVLRCLQRDRAKRPQSAAELAALLRPLQTAPAPAPVATPEPSAPRRLIPAVPVAVRPAPAARSPLAWWVAAVLAAVMGALIGGFGAARWLETSPASRVAATPVVTPLVATPAATAPTPTAVTAPLRAEPTPTPTPALARPATPGPVPTPGVPAAPPKHARPAPAHPAAAGADDDVFGKR